MIEIAKPWLPLTRELSSKARLRERKCSYKAFSDYPSVCFADSSPDKGSRSIAIAIPSTNPDLSLKKQTCLAKAIFSCFCRACLFYFPLINPPLKLLCFFTVPLLFDYKQVFIGCANCRKTPLKVLRNRPHKYRRKFAGGGERAGHKD